MSALQVLAAGAFATVQDRGRPGLAHIGVSGSGVADRRAAALANRLVGNDPDAAVVESLLGDLRLRADDRGVVVAVTGAPVALTVGGAPWPVGTPAWLPPHTECVIGRATAGLRVYVAVRGGIDVPPVLGSRSYDTLSRLGPPPLAVGDELPIGARVATAPWRGAAVPITSPAGEIGLDVLPGPRADWTDLEALAASRWEVASESDRIGVRLAGDAVPRRAGELPSEGLVRGAVQLPADGRPVIFGADHPTTGGYPVVAVLTDRASDRLAQCPPGTSVRMRLRPGPRLR